MNEDWFSTADLDLQHKPLIYKFHRFHLTAYILTIRQLQVKAIVQIG